jgi:hypothetical protein
MTATPPVPQAPILDQPLFKGPSDRKVWTWIGIIAILTVYAAAISPHWWIGHDSALYLTLARNLADGRGYTLAGQPHTHVPPGFPLFLAGLNKMGAGGFLALNSVMCLLGLATLALVFLLLRRLVHRDWAFVLTVVLGLSNEMLQRSGEILSDVPFMLLVTAALLLCYRGWAKDRPAPLVWELASLLLVACCWFRAAGLPLVLGAVLGLALAARGKARLRAAANAAAVCTLLAVCLVMAYQYIQADAQPTAGSYTGSLKRLLADKSVLQLLAQTLAHFYAASGQLSRLLVVQRLPLWLCMILWVVPIAWGMVLRMKRGDFIGPITVAVYVAGLSMASALPRTRYFLPIAPLLLLYLVEGWAWLVSRVTRKPIVASFWGAGLMIVLLAFNLPLVGRNIYQKHRHDAFASQQDGKWRDSIAAGEFLSAMAPIDGNVLAEQVVGYLSRADCPAVSAAFQNAPPPPEELEWFLRRQRIAYVTVDTRKPAPLDSQLQALLAPQGPPVFTHGSLQLYRFKPSPASQSTTPQTRQASTERD